MNALLPPNVDNIEIFANVLCRNRCKLEAIFYTFPSSLYFQGSGAVWRQQEFYFADLMHRASFSAFVDILEIEYNDDTPNYIKPIFIKVPSRDLYLSDTFDDVNNNWGVRLYPMGYDYSAELEDR